jgi:hypothetical protein
MFCHATVDFVSEVTQSRSIARKKSMCGVFAAMLYIYTGIPIFVSGSDQCNTFVFPLFNKTIPS